MSLGQAYAEQRSAERAAMRLQDHLPGFYTARGYSASSRRQRASILGGFITSTGNPRAGDLTKQMCLDWWASVAHLATNSRRAHLAAVRGFVDHLMRIDAIDHDPTRVLSRPKPAQRSPVTLRPDQVVRLLATVGTVRDRAAVSLMLGCGLRSSDVASLRIEDVDLAASVLSVLGKGGKRRLVPMPTAVVDAVRALLDVEGRTEGPLVASADGAPLSASWVQRRVTAQLRDAGVKRGPHDGRSSHVLRRTCATTLLGAGVSIRDVQTVLGHASIATTQAYLALPDTEHLVRVVELGPLAGADSAP